MTRKDFRNIVKQAWRTNYHGSRLYNLVSKTKLLKKHAKGWNKSTFGNVFTQLQTIEKQLSQIQIELCSHPTKVFIKKQIRIMEKKAKILCFQKIYWNQRAKVKPRQI